MAWILIIKRLDLFYLNHQVYYLKQYKQSLCTALVIFFHPFLITLYSQTILSYTFCSIMMGMWHLWCILLTGKLFYIKPVVFKFLYLQQKLFLKVHYFANCNTELSPYAGGGYFQDSNQFISRLRGRYFMKK